MTNQISNGVEQNKKSNLHLPSLGLGLISGVAAVTLIGVVILHWGEVALPEKAQESQKAEVSGSFQEKTTNVGLENLGQLSEQEKTEVLAYLRFKEIKESFVPSGVPELSYGKELGVNFDKVQESMNKLRVYGPTYGEEGKKITLTGKDKERYINIASQTACKYCCGAKALVREDGEAACGCAHSIVMRALAAFLIKNYPQLSDQRILEELNTWRKTFFPKQTLTEELQKRKEAGEAGIEELLETFPEFMPQMVGGC